MASRSRFSSSPVLLLCFALVGLWIFVTPGRAAAADPKVALSASFEPGEARRGEHVALHVDAVVPAGYHLYSLTKIADGPLPLSLPVDDPALRADGEWFAPTPTVEVDPNFAKAVEFYAGEVRHSRSFELVGGEPGAHALALTIRGQICDEHQCLSFKEQVAATLTIAQGEARADRGAAIALAGEAFPADRAPPIGAGGDEAQAARAAKAEGSPPAGEGMLSFLVIAFLAGLGALVTPCVFPMIPITIGFFSKFSKVSLRRTISMATIYSVSIIGTFTLVGVLVSVIFGAVGMQAISASIAFNAFLAALLVVFAFNLFGLFEIQVPSFLIAKTSRREHELKKDGAFAKQALGVFFMGLTFTLISFTCTVGFIGVVLAEAAKGNWFFPAVGMLTFSLAFSLPFFFLAVFPSWAEQLKGRAGDWMVAVKVVLGFLELAGAFKFVSNVDLLLGWGVITRPFVLAVWTAIFLVAGLYLLRVVRLGDDHEPRAVGPIRMTFAIMILVLSAYSSTGIRDTKSMGGWIDGWLPPAVYPGQEAAAGEEGGGEELAWIKDDIARGMREGKAANLPVFIDFTGYTCTNCRYMEASVFPRPEIRKQLAQMTRVTVYTDCVEAVCEEQRDYQVSRFDTAALPFYAVINPHDDAVLATFASSTNDPAEFEAFLTGALASFAKVEPATPVAAGAAASGASDDVAAGAAGDGEAAGDGDHAGGAGNPPAGEAGAYADLSVELIPAGEALDFRFPRLDGGEPFALSSLRGKWVFVNYWASWCAPCKKELKGDFPPALAAAPQIQLVTIAFDGDETKDQSIAFAKEIGLFEYPTLQGGEDIEEAELPAALVGGATLPQSYLIAPDGHLAWSHVGSVDAPLLARLFAQAK